MKSKKEYLEILKEFEDDFFLHTPRFVTFHSPRFMGNIYDLKQLIEEHFKLVDKAELKKIGYIQAISLGCVTKEKINICPSCRVGIDFKANYCPCCGQALDWREEDEE